jgi:2-dehydropantoate 2-reductase
MLWRKLLWNCGFNALTAITRRYASAMAEHDETRHIVEQAMQETITLAQTNGIRIGQADIDKHIEITLAMGPVKTSMWQDIEAGNPTEVDYINGYITRQMEKIHADAPTNRMLTSIIHSIEGRD